MVGNTYPYAVADWRTDIDKAVAYGIDGFALNMGSDWWQPNRIADAYTAAQQSGSGFKMFLSLDMTVMSCNSWSDAATLVNLVQRWANHPNQAKHNGKALVSTFAGSDCTFGMGSNYGWQQAFVNELANQGTPIFFIPSIFSDPSTFQSNTWMDGELNWNSAWPMGSDDLDTSSDWNYINQLGGKEYMAAISPFFFTHFGANSWNKNWLYRSDDWLYATRWEQLIAMRDQVKSLEILTWNDYGESSYIGPIHGALPAGSETWTYGFDHESINVLTNYYSAAFKTGVYPAITKDQIVMWQRPHPRAATASNDGAGRPTGWDRTDDQLYAVVLTTGPADVTLTSGSNSQTYSVAGGLTKLKIDSGFGSISGKIVRDGNAVASYASAGFSYVAQPLTYNFNYYLGASS
jgi:glucan endo-1,3-alpha-glucosidase